LFVGPDPLFNTELAQLVTLAAHHALPASYFLDGIADRFAKVNHGRAGN
jgi:hypothetical protein